MDLLHGIRSVLSQDAARRNAAQAANRLVRRRLERDDAEAFVAHHEQSPARNETDPERSTGATPQPR